MVWFGLARSYAAPTPLASIPSVPQNLLEMITIVDKSTHYQLTLLDIPSFPDSLRAKLEAAEEAGPDEAREFLSWWVPACQKRGFIHGRIANAEEIVHARRLLTKYTLPQLRSEEHTSELQSQSNLVCRLLL